MLNPFLEYFRAQAIQAGNGITGYQGIRYQKGHGFFGRIMSRAVFPLLRFLGKKALTTGAQIASDVVLNNKDVKESARERLLQTGEDIANAGIERAKRYVQTGQGRKRRCNTVKKQIRNKIRKRFKKGTFSHFCADSDDEDSDSDDDDDSGENSYDNDE